MILEIEEYPEYFPKFVVKQLSIYDDDLEENVQVCDYSNEFNSFAVERKVIHTLEKDRDGYFKDGDFHSSLMSKRLQDQMAKINFYYDRNKWLLTEGSLINYAVKHPQQANYAYSMIGHCGTMNISFRECYDREDFLLNLFWINKESGSEPFTRQDIKSGKKSIISQMSSLAKIPSVGPKRAKIIFADKNYNSIKKIIDNVDSITELRNIGKTTQEAIRDWAFTELEIKE